MAHYVAFLRGMNLGRRRITNDALSACFTEMGFEEVSPFLASGNVVFRARARKPESLQRKIEGALAAALDYSVPTFVRTAAQVRAIAGHEPFEPARLRASSGKLQVMLLHGAPTATQRRAVLELQTDDDRLAFGDTELYWLPIGRMSDAALDLASIERAIGPTTTRTHRTLARIAAKFLAT